MTCSVTQLPFADMSGFVCRLGDRTLTVSYAEPKQSEMNQDQVKSVYVGGLTAAATEAGLKEFFVGLDIGAVRVDAFTLQSLAGLCAKVCSVDPQSLKFSAKFGCITQSSFWMSSCAAC